MIKNQYRLNLGHGTLDISKRTHIMGIINITPDSFSDGGEFFEAGNAVEHALKLVDEGADILDFGGESTRPGAESLSVEEEIRRVIPVIKAVIEQTNVPISVDTYRSETARCALESGVDIINDISGLHFDPRMAETIAEFDAACVVMHIKGTPRNMQNNPYYDDVIKDVMAWLEESIAIAGQAGIDQNKILIDPGIGFGKRYIDNITIHRRLDELSNLGKPILFGSSRKSFLGKILNLPVNQRLEGTIASVVLAVLKGANIVRVHDVKSIKRAVQTIDVLKNDNGFNLLEMVSR